MKQSILLAALCLAIAFIGILSCEKSDNDVAKQVFLDDAHNLAKQNNGFYSKVGQVDVIATQDGDQEILKINLHDATINPYEIKLYLSKGTGYTDLKSGKFEVLFLRSALILNDPVTGKKMEFIVRNDSFNEMQAKLPEGYISASARNAVGIAVYGNHANARTHSDLVPACATSGGPGSTSCSNTCCSVSCTTGYYASCQSSCSCVKSSSN
ncbi:hypothetical protein [Dyadobacter psychrophilus]|uniref:Uncharacterized protein n=1 Tax=Dyadobacter psychrophilus TaxID=651661 RepID=A0A1T5EIX8_9BACT|nr:hypothetical protein [Dyadobacter psychrophilus]SKB83894.1 hypothetical protein SAMN05660293_02506 [Dyadobacter psychrophilus]